MIRIEGLRKSWPGFTLEIEQLEIGAGEYFVVLGPSGAGKTVLLSCLGGLVQPDSGRIWFDDRDVTDLPPERRTVGWVSQSNTLFPHLTVAGNVWFGRRYCRIGSGRFDARVARLIELLDLAPLLDRRPADLSGGEIRRAMLARALALEPRVLLLDEPLIGLDPTTQERLRDELARIHRELGTTTFHITHDHVEARARADRIAVLRGGRIEQVGAADEVFERPATCFVARFTGAENLFALTESAASDKEHEVQILDRRLLPPGIVAAAATHVAIRPEHVEILQPKDADHIPAPELLQLKGTVESLAKCGPWLRVTVRCNGAVWVSLLHPRAVGRSGIGLGDPVTIVVVPQHVSCLKKGSDGE